MTLSIDSQKFRDEAPSTRAKCPSCGGDTLIILWDVSKDNRKVRVLCKNRQCDVMGPLADNSDEAIEGFESISAPLADDA